MSSIGVEQPTTTLIHRELEHIMGMPINLALRGRYADSTTGQEAWRAVVHELREVDHTFSTYREDSTISRLARGELRVADCPLAVHEVLALGRDAERRSGGAFSITLPFGDGIRRLDPSGVVKGWAVERAARFLRALEDTDFCLSAGGDMTCLVADPDREPWRVGIENPLGPTSLVAVVPMRSGAVATSGTAHRGQHIIDPRDGRSPRGVASVTVIATSLTDADIDATTAYVLGRDAEEWLHSRPIRGGLIVWSDGSTSILAEH